MSKIRPARAEFREWFANCGRTQGEVGAAIGASQQTVSKLLGDYEPSPDLARRIEEATGIGWLGWYDAAERKRLERQLESARALRDAV